MLGMEFYKGQHMHTHTDTFFQSHQGQNSYKHSNGINDHAYYVATYMAQKKKKKDST